MSPFVGDCGKASDGEGISPITGRSVKPGHEVRELVCESLVFPDFPMRPRDLD